MRPTLPTTTTDLLRCCWLVPVTAVTIYALPAVVYLVLTPLAGPATRSWLLLPTVVYIAAVPFLVVLVHFRLHRPRSTRVALAFLTGLASLVLGTVGFLWAGLQRGWIS
jgi:hypothetical protein